MNTVTTTDGTTIYFKDWGPRSAQPVVFHHGWPLTGDDSDAQMFFSLEKGYRVIAHDRRGHDRSSQVSDGHDMDHYAVESIDRTWMITLRSDVGPFGTMDRMGLGVVHHVAKLIGQTNPDAQKPDYARYLDQHFIQKSRLGVASGQGFYSYPNPSYAQPGFISTDLPAS